MCVHIKLLVGVIAILVSLVFLGETIMFASKSYQTADPLTKYVVEHSIRLTPIQKRLMDLTLKQPMGRMMGAPEVTQLLMNLIKHGEMKKVIEVGVFTGFSTLAFAMAVPDDGKVVACDISEDSINLGRPFWKEAGVEHKIDVRIKPAKETLDELIANGEAGTFDLAFIDADKISYDIYYEKCLQLLRKGGIIAVDNVFLGKSVHDETSTRPAQKEMRAFNEKLKEDQRIDINMLSIADGLTLAFKK